MAITTRLITGPIETPEHVVVAQGYLRVKLLYPIADDDTLIAPFKLEYQITDGEPETFSLATPGWYEFKILDAVEDRVWTFKTNVYSNGGSPISVAELWLLSRLEDAIDDGLDLAAIDAANLGSDGADADTVLTADGSGGSDWLPVGGDGLGDMTKAIYDPDDDGQVEAADNADTATLADDSTLFGGLGVAAFQAALADAVSHGAVLTWDSVGGEYTPNENFLIDDDGNILAGGIRIVGALYGNVFVMNQVYYLVDEETHVVVRKEDDVEVRLPDPSAHTGRVIEIKKASSDGFTVLISIAGGGLIDGEASYDLVNQYDAITVVAADDEWFIF